MPRHSETRRLPYSPAQMFDLVADVGRYPEFLPWVVATRVQSDDGRVLTAEMVVGFKIFREGFTSRVTLDRPRQLHVEYVSGPLKRLSNDWMFRPAPGGGCDVDFQVDFEFRSRTFERIAGAVFSEAFRRMVASFETRAAKLYGPGVAVGSSSSSAQSTA